ncbi:MAG: DUF5615 family PIN-like protein [Acidobacteriota bacterium]|nr:MAG: DUF5615 family PIN-like protein [Acidobacteriota bacterium]
MNFVADENVEKQIVDRLRQDGHIVLYVAEMQQGISDEEVLKQANSNQAVLITTDKDFGELVFRMGRINSGVILIRLEGLTPENKAALVSSSVQHHDAKLDNSFCVISPGRIRIRQKM